MKTSFLFPTKNKSKWLLLSILLSTLLTGCYVPGGYQVVRPAVTDDGSLVIMRLSQTHHFIVIHEGDSAWQLVNYRLNRENSSISGALKELPSQRITYEVVDPNTGNHAVEGLTNPLDEVHVKISKMTIDSSGQILILREDIKEIQVYDTLYKVNRAVAIPMIASGAALTTAVIISGLLVIINMIGNNSWSN